MTMTYENFQNSGSEEKNQEPSKAAPPQSFLCNILSWTHLLLLSLGLSLLLLVVVSVLGSQNSQLRRDLDTLRATLDNTTSKIKDEFQAVDSRGELGSHGVLGWSGPGRVDSPAADSMQGGISSLKEEVEDHRQELQAGRGLRQKVASLENTLEKKEQALKTDLSEINDRVQHLGKDVKALTCQLANLKNNGSEVACCPLHWTKHEGSCYWFSQSEKSWPEADKYCWLENSHLVVVNSLEEQKFLQNRLANKISWIGLTDQNGPWRWVDGTDFEKGFKYWAPEQPDDWYGHGLGGGEDCAQFTSGGPWNDDVCQKPYRWICEINAGQG